MRGKVRTAAGVLGASAALLFGAAAPALAGSSGGALVLKSSNCQDFGETTICMTTQVEYTTVQAASGNYVYSDNGKFSSTVTNDDGTSYASNGSFHDHFLVRDSDQEYHLHYSSITADPYFGTCTYAADFHLANGQVQFDDVRLGCA
jgi:hypothetical protein